MQKSPRNNINITCLTVNSSALICDGLCNDWTFIGFNVSEEQTAASFVVTGHVQGIVAVTP